MSEQAVLCKLGYFRHHADLQAAWLIQGQSRAAGLAAALREGTQQLAAVGVVERQTSQLVVQEGSHSLGTLSDKHGGLNVAVE